SRGVRFQSHFISAFGPAHSGLNSLDLADSADDVRGGPIVGTFTRLMTSVSLFAGSPFATGQTGTLKVFGSDGFLIGTDGPKPLGPNVDVQFSVTVSGRAIARFEFSQSPFVRPRIDDLSFNDGLTGGITPILGIHTTRVSFTRERLIVLGTNRLTWNILN